MNWTSGRGETCTPWATAADLEVCGTCSDLGLYDPAQIDVHLQVATDILYRLTGAQWRGICEETVRPCCADDICGADGYPFMPEIVNGEWYNAGTIGGCPDACVVRDCAQDIPRVDLGRWPVTGVLSVLIDGVLLDPGSYRLHDDRWLWRTDGDPWPATQDLLADSTEVGTWAVTFEWGNPPPIAAVRYASIFACEMLLACSGSASCKLPRRATSVTRQGVTYDVGAIADLIEKNMVGLPDVDLWVHSVNPNRLMEAPVVLTPCKARKAPHVWPDETAAS